MATTMLEYSKQILRKVSFDKEIFSREFKKANRHLGAHEAQELQEWCIRTFGYEYCMAVFQYA